MKSLGFDAQGHWIYILDGEVLTPVPKLVCATCERGFMGNELVSRRGRGRTKPGYYCTDCVPLGLVVARRKSDIR